MFNVLLPHKLLFPIGDLATPTMTTERAGARLRKRKERECQRRQVDTEIAVETKFPWNPACRAVSEGLPSPMTKWSYHGRPPCVVCKSASTRACICGAHFAKQTDIAKLSEFVTFIRASSTPVYNEVDPEDQFGFVTLASDIFYTGNRTYRALARFCIVAAFSGDPSIVRNFKQSLQYCCDQHFLDALAAHLVAAKPFWRAGQSHGPLRKDDLVSAFKHCFSEQLGYLAELLEHWDTNVSDQRSMAIRKVMEFSGQVWKTFQAADYFQKRFFEMVVLFREILPGHFTFRASDIDCVADVLPLGPGTKRGLRTIWPRLRGDNLMRQGAVLIMESNFVAKHIRRDGMCTRMLHRQVTTTRHIISTTC